MIKYYNAMVVFEEIPNEITLAINITNCPCHCKGCHSKFLWEDVGTELTIDELNRLIDKNDGITTVCFMGGDATPEAINTLAEYVHEIRELKVGWYSGMDEYYKNIKLWLIDDEPFYLFHIVITHTSLNLSCLIKRANTL